MMKWKSNTAVSTETVNLNVLIGLKWICEQWTIYSTYIELWFGIEFIMNR